MKSSQSSGIVSTLPPVQFGAPINLEKFMENHASKPYDIKAIEKHNYLAFSTPSIPGQDIQPLSSARLYQKQMPSELYGKSQIGYDSPELIPGYSDRPSNKYSCSCN